MRHAEGRCTLPRVATKNRAAPKATSNTRRGEPRHGQATVPRYKGPNAIRVPLLQFAQAKFESVYEGPWLTYRSAFEHDVAEVRTLLDAFEAARAAEKALRAHWRPEWEASGAPPIAKMLHKQLVDLWSALEHDPDVRDAERSAIVLAVDLADRHKTVTTADGKPIGGILDEKANVRLAAAVSILMSNGVRPEIRATDLLTCAEAFERERKTIEIAASRRVGKPGLSQMFPSHVTSFAAVIRSRKMFPSDK